MDPYSDARCEDCGEDLFQLDGEWHCPECEDVDEFTLDVGRDGFAL